MSNHMIECMVRKCKVSCPYLIHILTGFLDYHSTKSLEAYIDFIHDRYHTLLELVITIFLVSSTCGNH